MKRYENLDLLRGIAALAVVLYHYFYHYSNIYGTGINLPIFAVGKLGVNLFFVLSGFVIFISLHRACSSVNFIKKRFNRLFPTYWLCLVLTFAVVSILGLPGREVDFITFLINFTMLQEFLGYDNLDGAYWTLTYELAFYFISALVFLNVKKFSSFTLLNVFIIALHLLILRFWEGYLAGGLIKLLIIPYYPYFAFGMVMYYLKENKVDLFDFKNLSNIFLSWLNISLLTTYLILVEKHFLLCLSTVFITYLFIKFEDLRIPTVILKFGSYLGGISYPLYLLHQNIGFSILNYFGESYQLISYACAFILVFILAHIVEKNAYLVKKVYLNDNN